MFTPEQLEQLKGQDGKDGLTTSIKIGDNTYTHVDGVIELPNDIIYNDTEIREKLAAIDELLASDNLDLDTLQEIVDVLEQDNADIAELKQRLDEMPSVELPTEWDADKVGFGQDLIFTKTFGKYEPDSTGSVTIPTKTDNMSLQDLLLTAFSEEKNPTTTQPTFTLTSSNIGAKEVGTKISVAYQIKDTTTGSYTYGPATGVTWSDFSAKFNGQTVTGQSGTFNEIQVTDDTNLSISGSAKHSAGATPKTNLGNDFTPETITDTSGAIQEKTITKTKGTLSGYRKMF